MPNCYAFCNSLEGAPPGTPAIDSSTLFSSTRFGKTVHDCKQQAEEYIRLQVHMQKIRAQILYFERQLQRSQLAQLAKAKREELDDQVYCSGYIKPSYSSYECVFL